MWRREDIMWFAGFFEGEGCLHYVGSNRWTMTISSTDLDVLEKVVAALDMGRVYGPYSRSGRPQCKPIWNWRVVGAKKVYALAMAIYPFMGKRRGGNIVGFVEKFKLLAVNPRARDVRGKFVEARV